MDFEKAMQEFEKKTNDPNSVYGHNKAVGKYYNIRGFKMYAEIYGQGKPILFIHGNGGSGSNFFKQVPYFAKKYKVIIADSPFRLSANGLDLRTFSQQFTLRLLRGGLWVMNLGGVV